MESNLFVELSDEQQQLVAGGGQLIGLDDSLSTYYTAERSLVGLSVVQASGPNGSANVQQFAQDFTGIDTGANKDFYAMFQ